MKIFTVNLALVIFALVAGRVSFAENRAFKVGEKLTYNIDWGILTVGRATLEVKGVEKIDGRDCYHIVAEAQTTGLGDLLYKVRSTAESWLDMEGLFTRKYVEDRREGKSRHCDEIIYDYENKKTVIKNRDTGKEETVPLEKPVVDAVGFLYAARIRGVAMNNAGTYTINAGAQNYDVSLKPEERKEMRAKAVGKIPALRLEPDPTLKIVAKNGGRAWFWVSDDERRLPILGYSKMKIGSAKMELTDIEPKEKQEAEKKETKTNFGFGKKSEP